MDVGSRPHSLHHKKPKIVVLIGRTPDVNLAVSVRIRSILGLFFYLQRRGSSLNGKASTAKSKDMGSSLIYSTLDTLAPS